MFLYYRISDHAQKQMKARNISPQSVDAVMQAPEQIVSEQDGKKCYQSRYQWNGSMFLLRVIVADTVVPAIVVTVYYTNNVRKYWI